MLTESYNGERALFLGNGIHRTESNNGISWFQLLEKIANKYSMSTDLENDLKPFPLAFEEMLYVKEGLNDTESKIRNLKRGICEILEKDSANLIDLDIHRGFMQCGIKEIITTNYDYNLETSVFPRFFEYKTKLSINNLESKHSLFRGYIVNDVKVRHIHGELKHNRRIVNTDSNYNEESIMIGFEHYSDYFVKIQNVIKGESGRNKEEEKKSLLVRLRDEQVGKIWTDLFFTHQLIIAGFSFDFSENHLWWLILQRQLFMRESNRYNIKINNEIIFCIPNFPTSGINYKINSESEFDLIYKRRLGFQKNKGVTDILASLNITINRITCNSYKEFYQKIILQYSTA